eukprot:TCONS_00067233-protein
MEDWRCESKVKEKSIPFEFDENYCDVIIITKDREIHLPSSFLVSNNGGQIFSTGAETEEFSSEDVLRALSFYYPKYWTSHIECDDLDNLLSIATTFKMTKFQVFLEKHIQSDYLNTVLTLSLSMIPC